MTNHFYIIKNIKLWYCYQFPNLKRHKKIYMSISCLKFIFAAVNWIFILSHLFFLLLAVYFREIFLLDLFWILRKVQKY